MKIGYVRVSTEEQNTARQEIMLRELGWSMNCSSTRPAAKTLTAPNCVV